MRKRERRNFRRLTTAAIFLTLAWYPFMARAQQVTFNFTGGPQTYVVPAGVTSVAIDARGAQGGAGGGDPLPQGGKGGRVQTTLAVTPGETLVIYVGGRGGDIDLTGPNTAGPGGFNGGGSGGIDNVDFNAPSGGGGGASDVRQGGNGLANRVVVAGGGGGAEVAEDGNGGDGGGLIGATGGTAGGGSAPGGGGTQSAGGAGGAGCNGNGSDGSLGQGGIGGNGNRAGGGGGGGYYGGGGGGGCLFGSGGGGGSSYSAGTGTTHTQGYQTGDGQIVITIPGFLSFPLLNKTQSSAAINTVFDHSSVGNYCANPDQASRAVTAYTGERGVSPYFGDYVVFRCSLSGVPNRLYSFANGSGDNFTVNGNYTGGGAPGFLSYEGHPGYDYRTTDQNQDGSLCSSYPQPCNTTGKTPVLAAADGTVVCVINNCSEASAKFGEVKIDHGNGYSTVYLHLSKAIVRVGEHVVAGQPIGISGDAGVQHNPHLHFEVRRNDGNVPTDPYGWKGPGSDPYTRAVNTDLWK